MLTCIALAGAVFLTDGQQMVASPEIHSAEIARKAKTLYVNAENHRLGLRLSEDQSRQKVHTLIGSCLQNAS